MGMKIDGTFNAVYLLLRCDTVGCRTQQRFSNRRDTFLNNQAMRAGWKNTFERGERLWLCPRCSGKVKVVDDD